MMPGTVSPRRTPHAARRTVLAVQLLSSLWCADPWDALSAACADKDPAPRIEALLREHPDFLAARYNLGTVLIASDAQKAAEQLTLATADPALAPDAWHNLALARWKQGRLDEALVAAEEAAKRAPQDAAKATLRDELRRVAVARADAARRAAEEAAKKLAFSGDRLPEAHVGEPYRAMVPLRGGTAPYRVAIARALPLAAGGAAASSAAISGTTLAVPPADNEPPLPAPAAAPAATPERDPLPPGLTLDLDGVVSGTPTTAGTYSLKLAVQDAASAHADGTVTITVVPAPAITTNELPEAIIGVPYRATLASEGLHHPTWKASGLPAGLRCAEDGTISGTSDARGTYQVSLSAAEVAQPPLAPRAAGRTLELVVGDTFAPDAPLPPATAGAAYDHRLGVRGPVMAYRWQTGAGSPLTVEADGRVHGTVDRDGQAHIPVVLNAADGRQRPLTLPLTVNPRPLIAAEEPLRGTVGQPLDAAIPHTGGTPPFTWTVTEGSLPTGTRIDADGHLRGSPREAGKHAITVRLADRWAASTQSPLTIEIADRPKDQDSKDQQQDQNKDQKQDQAGKDQKDQKDQSKGDQSKQEPKDKPGQDDGQKPGEAGKNEEKQAENAKKAQEDEKKKQAERDAAAGAAINQMATDRWLDQLPQEDRGVLRYQLLDGGDRKPQRQGKPW